MRIYIFVWNAGNLAICETVSREAAQENRKWFWQRLVRSSCAVPDFFTEIRRTIESQQIDLAIIYTIDAGTGSKFHSDLLPKELESMQFSQLLRYKETRTSEKGAVRVSAYIKSKQLSSVIQVYDDSSRICSQQGPLVNRVGGAFGFRIRFRELGMIGFMALSLPDATEALLNTTKEQQTKHLRTVTQANNLCITAAFDELWGGLAEQTPRFSFVFGDLNYGVAWPGNSSESGTGLSPSALNYSSARQYDALASELLPNATLEAYQEGVNGTGPSFPPDYPHLIDRSTACQTSGTCFDYRQEMPAWTSRILYSRPPRGIKGITCLSYNKFDFGNLRLAAHVGVNGIYELQLTA